MSLHDTDNNLFSTAMSPDAFTEHVESLSHPGRVPEEELEDSLFCLRCCLFQPLLRGFRHSCHPRCGVTRRISYNSRVKGVTQNPILRFTISAATVSAIVFVYFRWLHVNPTTVGFSLLLAILLISAAWGLRYAIFTAILATVAYNYFFLPPLFRFTIADPQNWIALFAFLITAVVASQLSERARRGTANADQRRREVERLYSFSQQLWLSENVFELLNIIPKHIVDSFAVSGAALFLEGKQEAYCFDEASRSLFPIGQLKAISDRGEPVLDREHKT